MSIWMEMLVQQMYVQRCKTAPIKESNPSEQCQKEGQTRKARWEGRGKWTEGGKGRKTGFFTPFHTSAAAWWGFRFCDPHRTGTQNTTKWAQKKEKRMSASISYSLNRLQCIWSAAWHLWKSSINSTPEERPCKAKLLQSMPFLCCSEKQSKKYSLATITVSFQNSLCWTFDL